MKEYKDFTEKTFNEKTMQIAISLGYAAGIDDINKVIENIEKAYIKEDKLKKFNEKLCYHADKIGMIATLLSMKRLSEKKEYEDILVLCRYMLKEINKITDTVESEAKKNA